MISTPEGRKKVWIGAGVVSTLLLGLIYMRRKKSAAAKAASNNGPDGNPIIKGLVFYPTENYFGARPISQITSDRSARTIVPINHRKTDALVAVAIVEENIVLDKKISDEKEVIRAILIQRGGESAGYDLDSLASVVASNSKKTVGRQPCQFTYTITSKGSLLPNSSSSAASQSLFTFFKYIEETNSLVELVIDHSLVSDQAEVAQLRDHLYITSVIDAPTASLISTIPSSSLRLAVPASKWNFVTEGTCMSVLQLASDAKNVSIRMDDESKTNSDNTNEEASSITRVLANLPAGLIASQTKMSDDELLASPKLVTSVVHKQLGVEFPAVQNATILEPRYAATETLSLVASSSSDSSSSVRTMTFERWCDAPEQWWYTGSAASPTSSNNNNKNANLTKDEVDFHFLREVRMLLLPLHVKICGEGPCFVSACGHEEVALLEAALDGRRVRIYIFRRQANKEIIVLRQEDDEGKWENESVPFFRNLMDRCLITK